MHYDADYLHGMKADYLWLDLLRVTLNHGVIVRPRGFETREIFHQTTVLDMLHPLVTIPERKLNYAFAAAEARWIIDGSNDLERLTCVNREMAKYSDDGKTLTGAYGPRIISQLDYVVKTLTEDPDSRQAVLTIWRENPAPSKDIPCTVALAFYLRSNLLHVHAFMRSSDIWRGWPYDVFSFSVLGYFVTLRVSAARGEAYEPGNLYLTAGSSHLYESDFESARKVLQQSRPDPWVKLDTTLMSYFTESPHAASIKLYRSLEACEKRIPITDDEREWRWLIRPEWSEDKLRQREPGTEP